MNILISSRLAALAVAAAMSSAVQAQADPAKSYPDKAVHVIIGFAAGGGTDVLGRLICQKISEASGQSVVVENKLGAGGMIAAEYVAKAKPDGYTLLFAPSAVFTTNPVMYSKVPYSPTRDFIPISMAVTYPFFLVVNASQPFKSVKELVNFIKAQPQKANYSGSAGIFQLTLELFKLRTGTQIQYIPYKGTNEAINAVMAGDVLMTVADSGPASGALKGGRIRALAVTAAKRMPNYPDVPTMAEAGLADMVIQSWAGLFAPASTSMAIVRKLQDDIVRIVKMPDVRERMATLQVEPEGNTSEEFARLIASDLARWREVAKAGHIKPAD